MVAAISDECGPTTSHRVPTRRMSVRPKCNYVMDQRGLVGTRRIEIATFAWRRIDKSARSRLAGAFFGVAFLCKNITTDHFQAASQRTCAALSSRFLIPLLTMWAAAFVGTP